MLGVYSLPIASFREQFAAPKPRLRIFRVFDLDAVTGGDFLGVLVAKGISLEEFSYVGSCPQLDILRRFAAANPSLLNVNFKMKSACSGNPSISPQRTEKIEINWSWIVGNFIKCCPNLCPPKQ